MHLLLFVLLLVPCWSSINVSINEKGAYNVSINGTVWLQSSRTALYVDNTWYSSDWNTLPLISISTGEGNDPNWGRWNETQLNYDLIRNGTHTNIVGRIRQWYDISAITFHLDTGNQVLTNTMPLNTTQVRTIFPSFYVKQIDKNDQRGYFAFEGTMTGDGGKHAGTWNSSNMVVQSAMESAPVVVFNFTQRGENDMLVLSPFSRFMATSLCQTNNVLEYGVMGSIVSIPANYNHSMIVFYSSKGINEGIREWGQAMQKAFNRTTKNRLNDITLNYLGYYTDGGAYYYYNTEQGLNYEETIMNIRYQIPLPFHYIQFDSWWYYKGVDGGVSEYTARPDIFPNGLQVLHQRLENIPLAAHNRYWAYDNVYKQNYSFALDEVNGKALPIGNDSFWFDLFTQIHDWGLVLYEQDWLNVQTEQFLPTQTDIHLGHQWLTSMGEAADKIGINIQYCMSLPRHILTALEVPRVTQARASTDYIFHLTHGAQQWAIGISSMFADAVGIAPFKDVFWSTSQEPGAHYTPNPQEIFPEREILMATLSTGPVGSGDAINYTNVERIMKCCRSDGLILKPDRPLTTINALIADWALYKSVSQGELYSTRTTINNQAFHIVFASDMKRDYLVYPSMIGAEAGVVWWYNNSQVITTFDNAHPLQVLPQNCGNLSICLWYISPLESLGDASSTQYALLGEWNKWTAVSQQRFSSITTDAQSNQATIVVEGVAGETVPVGVFHSVLRSVTVNCSFTAETSRVNLVIRPSNIVCA